MSNDPAVPDPDDDAERDDSTRGQSAGGSGSNPSHSSNPFQGTPFEQMFGNLGGQFGAQFGGGPGGMPVDLGAIMGQLQKLMAPHDGPVNWEYVVDIARQQAAQTPDPSASAKDAAAVADALRLADLWLDEATDFESGVTATAAWSRAEWIVATTEVWKVLVEPIATQATGALAQAAPEQAMPMLGPLMDILGKASGMMVATQVGQGVGALAGEVLSASEIGLPLGPSGTAALLPHNVRAFADDLGVGYDDLLLYLALREAAHQRLFARVPWLREHLLDAVRDYAAGIEIDISSIEEQLSGLDPSDPAAIQQAMGEGLFEPKQSPAQQAALSRLETTLALVEGWVDEVVGQATAERMPVATRLQEAIRRRRAAGGPAEQVFARLVGLELRPRRLRDASTLWGSLRARQGTEGREAVWMDASLLPTSSDLDDPLGFREGLDIPTESMSDEKFDEELAKLLDSDPDSDSDAGTDAGPDSGSDKPE